MLKAAMGDRERGDQRWGMRRSFLYNGQAQRCGCCGDEAVAIWSCEEAVKSQQQRDFMPPKLDTLKTDMFQLVVGFQRRVVSSH